MRSMKFAALLFAFAAAPALAADPVVVPPPPAAPAPVAENILDLDLSTGGRVQVLLRPDKAPGSVARIKTLARRGFYNGLTFHRVIEGFMAQGGDPKGTGEGGSDLPDLKAEFSDLPHLRGVMSMARAEDVNSANSQFFIMLSPNFQLDRRYTAVGRVISGMAYVDAIQKGEPPENPSKIVRATIAGDQGKTPAEIAAADAADQAAAAAAAAAPAPTATTTGNTPDPKAVKAAEKAKRRADKDQAKQEREAERAKAKEIKEAGKQARRTVNAAPEDTAVSDAATPAGADPALDPAASPAPTIDDPVPTPTADPTPPQR